MNKEGQENFKKRQEYLQGLIASFLLYTSKPITRKQKRQIQEWKDRMEFRLSELLDKSKQEEVEIKVGVFEEMVKLLKDVQ